ncbi:MAG TPA: YbaK/EbsC family protein [Thermoleophilaceae bacterium]|jgi:prolyl-tRNA editing enzyme YbaK/EbsC (Cys-tRNA(Pro) deacylase)
MRDKVAQAARELGLEVEITTLDRPTRTVAEAAEALDVDPGQIAKSIVFVADGEPVVCVASGGHRVDIDTLALAFDCAVVSQADPDQVQAATGFKVGGVPPFGHGLPVVIDEALLDHEVVFAAGGDGSTLFGVDPRKLVDATGARVIAVGAAAAG